MSALPRPDIGIDDDALQNAKHLSPVLASYVIITHAANYMRKLLPEIRKDNALKSYYLLCYISTRPRRVQSNIARDTGIHKATVSKLMQVLLKHRLIKEVPLPRLIVPFQAYVINTGYMILPKGEKVLKNLFDN